MKPQKTIITLGVAAALSFIVGCDSKTTTQTETKADTATTAAPKKTESLATEATKAVEAAKPAVEQAVKNTTATASATAAEAATKVNAIIEQAKTLLGQTKYTDALNTLQQLSSFTLTPEQDQLVSALKDQINKAMAAKATTDGAKAVGNLLPK